MIITNPNNLPLPLVLAVTPDQDRGLDPSRLSVTDLINPPLMRKLRLEHWHEMEERVDDRAWLMLGQAFHDWIDKRTPGNSEIKIEMPYADLTLVGVIDLIQGVTIADYKVVSANSFLLGEKFEWEAQLNVYSYLANYIGIQITNLTIIAILRDWQLSKTYHDYQYPKSPLLEKQIRLWNYTDRESYISTRVMLHLSEDVPECAPSERWDRPDSWAVKVPNVQKARRVLSSFEEAEAWIRSSKEKKQFFIEHRPGARIRCRDYCAVRNFCPNNIYKEEGYGGACDD